METIVTVAVVVDLGVEISYYGVAPYFTGRDSRSTAAGVNVLRCLSHWFQLFVTILCVMALLLYTFAPEESSRVARAAAHRVLPHSAQTGPGGDEDTLVSLFLLLIRYAVYVCFLVVSSTRSMQMQGCCDNQQHWDVGWEERLSWEERPQDMV